MQFDGTSSQWTEGAVVLIRVDDGWSARGRVYELLAGPAPAERDVVAVLYRESSTSFVDGWRDHLGGPPNDLRVLSAGEPTRAPGGERELAEAVVEGLDEPADLGSVAGTVGRALRDWSERASRSVVYLDSLPALLEYVDGPRAGDFLDRLASECREWDASGFVCTSPLDDNEALEGFGVRLDATVEIGQDGTTAVEPPILAPSEADGPPLDAVLDALAVPERRYVLAHLAVTGSASIDELAASLSRRSGDASDDAESSAHERAIVTLYQVHLPKLADAALVRFDEAARAVELRSEPPIEPFLDLATSYEPW